MPNITVTVSFTGLVDIKNFTSGSSLELEAGTTVSGLLSRLGIKEPHKKYLIVTVGGKTETLFYGLQNNDEVKLFLQVGGG